jgi:hypothetical protein
LENGSDLASPGPGKRTLTEQLSASTPQRGADAVQLAADGSAAANAPATHEAAAAGLQGTPQPLPHLDRIQQAFGPHDVTGTRAFIGGPAADASRAMGARAYATGDATAFAAPPDLHTAAHEAAHVVQQRAGVQLSGGAGQAGDAYEQHADAVADLVVRGQSAAAELDRFAPSSNGVAGARNAATAQRAGMGGTVQRAPGDAPVQMPALGGAQHKEWSVTDFIAMWEKQHGSKMSDDDKAILAHGCIGVTALHLGRGSHNPPLGLSFSTFEQAKQVQMALNNILKAKPAADKLGEMIAKSPQLADLKNVLAAMPVDPDPTKWHAYIFSKRFFSRQTGTWEERKSGDATKFTPDKHGQVDMPGNQSQGRADVDAGPGNNMVNFDYGWYDEVSNSWLHANHADPDMKVYQSTLEYYSRPLRNFDRQVFTVAFARVSK